MEETVNKGDGSNDFDKVTGFKYTRIQLHSQYLKYHFNEVMVMTFDQLKNYNDRDYIRHLELESKHDKKFTAEHGRYISCDVESLKLFGYENIEENSIPSTIKTLYLEIPLTGNMFVDKSGDNITTLRFSDEFNQPLEWFPPKLKELALGSSFKQSIAKLPETLTYLYLDEEYPYKNIFPESIKTDITPLNYYDVVSSKDIIPSNTINHKFNLADDPLYIKVFPEHFNFSVHKDFLLPSLQSITFGSNYNKDIFINGNSIFSPILNLKKLKFGRSFNKPIEKGLPSSINALRLGENFSQRINSNTFKSLKNLEILDIRSSEPQLYQLNEDIFPESIKSLLVYRKTGFKLPKFLLSLVLYGELNGESPKIHEENLNNLVSITLYMDNAIHLKSFGLPGSLKAINLNLVDENGNYNSSYSQIADFLAKYRVRVINKGF